MSSLVEFAMGSAGKSTPSPMAFSRDFSRASARRRFSLNVRRLQEAVSSLFDETDKQDFVDTLNEYHLERNVFNLVQGIKVILDNPHKQQLVPLLRKVIPQNDIELFDQYWSNSPASRSAPSSPSSRPKRSKSPASRSLFNRTVETSNIDPTTHEASPVKLPDRPGASRGKSPNRLSLSNIAAASESRLSGRRSQLGAGGPFSDHDMNSALSPAGIPDSYKHLTFASPNLHAMTFTESTGFGIRAGPDRNIYISFVDLGTWAEKESLMPGDRLVSVNDISLSDMSLEEAQKILNSAATKLDLVIEPVGSQPTVLREHMIWIDPAGRPTSPPCIPGTINRHNRFAQRKINLVLNKGQNLGLMIRGGNEFNLGIYVTGIDEGSVAEYAGLKVGDQILDVNGVSFVHISHTDAVRHLRGLSRAVISVAEVGKIPYSKTTHVKQLMAKSSSSGSSNGYGSMMDEKRSDVLLRSAFNRGAGSQLMHVSVSSHPHFTILERHMHNLLTPSQQTTLKYYLAEYTDGRINIGELVLAFLELLNTNAKLELVGELRNFILPMDLDRYDALLMRRERGSKENSPLKGVTTKPLPPLQVQLDSSMDNVSLSSVASRCSSSSARDSDIGAAHVSRSRRSAGGGIVAPPRRSSGSAGAPMKGRSSSSGGSRRSARANPEALLKVIEQIPSSSEDNAEMWAESPDLPRGRQVRRQKAVASGGVVRESRSLTRPSGRDHRSRQKFKAPSPPLDYRQVTVDVHEQNHADSRARTRTLANSDCTTQTSDSRPVILAGVSRAVDSCVSPNSTKLSNEPDLTMTGVKTSTPLPNGIHRPTVNQSNFNNEDKSQFSADELENLNIEYFSNNNADETARPIVTSKNQSRLPQTCASLVPNTTPPIALSDLSDVSPRSDADHSGVEVTIDARNDSMLTVTAPVQTRNRISPTTFMHTASIDFRQPAGYVDESNRRPANLKHSWQQHVSPAGKNSEEQPGKPDRTDPSPSAVVSAAQPIHQSAGYASLRDSWRKSRDVAASASQKRTLVEMFSAAARSTDTPPNPKYSSQPTANKESAKNENPQNPSVFDGHANAFQDSENISDLPVSSAKGLVDAPIPTTGGASTTSSKADNYSRIKSSKPHSDKRQLPWMADIASLRDTNIPQLTHNSKPDADSLLLSENDISRKRMSPSPPPPPPDYSPAAHQLNGGRPRVESLQQWLSHRDDTDSEDVTNSKSNNIQSDNIDNNPPSTRSTSDTLSTTTAAAIAPPLSTAVFVASGSSETAPLSPPASFKNSSHSPAEPFSPKSVMLYKTKPTLGIAIEGGANTKQPIPRVISIQPTGSAYDSTLSVGDLLLSVDGVSLTGLEHKVAARQIAQAFKSKQRNWMQFIVHSPETK